MKDGGVHIGGTPIARWFVIENPTKIWMISGYLYVRKPPYDEICVHPKHEVHALFYHEVDALISCSFLVTTSCFWINPFFFQMFPSV